MAVGGGSGGHVTPVVAVLSEIKKIAPDAKIRFWCDRKFEEQAKSIVGNFDKNIPVHVITAGKLRRYHHLTVLRQLLWPSLVLRNIRDFFLVGVGFFQSFFKLIIWRPDVVFTKGGYVCLPVGIAAKILRIPLAIHDSDAHPGLTNRVLGKWADKIMTGAPLDCYSYPKQKSQYVGIPIASTFRKFSDYEKADAKLKWGVVNNRPLVVITGGGLGATRINDTVIKVLNDLLKFCSVILVSGNGQYNELKAVAPANSDSFRLHAFISSNIESLFGAADVVIARAGATTILELAASAKTTILIPNAKLTGGHQVKNAKVYKDSNAVEIVDEDKMLENPEILVDAISRLLNNPEDSLEMAKRFNSFSKPNAAKDVAKIVLSLVN